MSQDDRRTALLAEAGEGRQRGFRHYIYVPDRTKAEALATKLRQDGFEVEVRMGADDVNWLVLVHSTLMPGESEIDRVCDQLASFANGIGGEYDGWEADVAEEPE